MTVTAVLVSHQGERWLPRVIEALARQTRLPDAIWAVDTGSTDASAELLRAALGPDRVVSLPADTPYATAVQAGLDAAGDTEWVWLLHDDSAPAPDALEALLAAAGRNPEASLLAPKLREWPSLRRLLEVGVTISGTAKRETGLERGEYDQGQHDRVRRVLAGNTAGLLVRRQVLDEIGLDPRLPVFATDLDLGWRAANAGLQTLAVPSAVVFHAEAAHRGQRAGQWTARPRRAERSAQMRTVLANCAPAAAPFLFVRLVLGTLLRALGLLLVRAPGDAWDEAAAALGVGLRPWQVVAARRRRRRTRAVPARAVRPLLPSAWLPYRHGWDRMANLASELALLTRESLARRSRERSWSWGLVLGIGLLAAAIVAGRDLLGGDIAGGALLPAPSEVGTWWSAIRDQPVGGWLLPAAVLATLLLGSPGVFVQFVLVLAVPLAAVGAVRFFRQLVGPVPAWWAALTYALTLGVCGVVSGGQLGTLVAGIVLPFLGRSALGMLPFAAAEQRRRAVWRVTAWLALSTAFAPSTWLLAVVVVVVALGLGLRNGAPRAVLPAVVPVLVTPLLLLPWVATRLDAPGLLLLDAGLPTPYAGLDLLEVLGGRVDGGAPAWWAMGIVVAALAVLLRRDTRPYVAWCWAFGGLALLLTAVLARVEVTIPATGEVLVPMPVYPLVVAQAAWICAIALGADGARRQVTGTSFGWRQPVAALVVLGAVASPVAAAAWWVAGNATDGLTSEASDPVPTYMTQLSAAQDGYDVLVLRPTSPGGDEETPLGWSIRRGPGVQLGLEAPALATAYDEQTARSVSTLLTDGDVDAVATLAAQGVGYVYAAPPAPPRVRGTLDATSGLSPASAPLRRAAAWQLADAGTGTRPEDRTQGLGWLLAGQAVVALVVAVLAAPGRRREEERS